MKKNSLLFFIIFLIAIDLVCGCTQTTSQYNTGLAKDISSTPATTASIATLSTTAIPVLPKDPIIGSWMCYNYLPSGKIQKVWTFRENNTWTFVNTNVKSQHKKFVNGMWKKESAIIYQITLTTGAPDTFTYDSTKDEFSDTYFRDTYVRVTEENTPVEKNPTVNITLFSAQSVTSMNGSRPYSGNKYLIVNISIKNINETGGFSFTDGSIMAISDDGEGSNSINQKFVGKLENPFPSGKIGPGEAQQGNVIFGVPAKSQSYILKLINNNGDVLSNIIEMKNIQTNETYSVG